MSPSPGARAVVPGVVAACGVAGTLTALLLSSGGGAAAAPADAAAGTTGASRPAVVTLPRPASPPPIVVTRPDGRRVSCPRGAEPTVTLTGAQFEPALTGGTSFVRGRYRIRLVGAVDDESGAGIDVRGVRLTLGGRAWAGRPIVATRVGAYASAALVVEGEYVARGPERVDLRAQLLWRWSDSGLAPCGTRGLVHDD